MKTNLVLALLACALMSSAYLDRRAASLPNDIAPAAASELLFSLPVNDIEAVRVRSEHRCRVWRAADPGFPPLLDLVVKTRILRRFSPVADDLAPYGLARPDRQFAVQRRGAARVQTVLIGDLNPVSDAVYAKKEDEADVLLIGGYFLMALGSDLMQTPSSDALCAELFDKKNEEKTNG